MGIHKPISESERNRIASKARREFWAMKQEQSLEAEIQRGIDFANAIERICNVNRT